MTAPVDTPNGRTDHIRARFLDRLPAHQRAADTPNTECARLAEQLARETGRESGSVLRWAADRTGGHRTAKMIKALRFALQCWQMGNELPINFPSPAPDIEKHPVKLHEDSEEDAWM